MSGNTRKVIREGEYPVVKVLKKQQVGRQKSKKSLSDDRALSGIGSAHRNGRSSGMSVGGKCAPLLSAKLVG